MKKIFGTLAFVLILAPVARAQTTEWCPDLSGEYQCRYFDEGTHITKENAATGEPGYKLKINQSLIQPKDTSRKPRAVRYQIDLSGPKLQPSNYEVSASAGRGFPSWIDDSHSANVVGSCANTVTLKNLITVFKEGQAVAQNLETIIKLSEKDLVLFTNFNSDDNGGTASYTLQCTENE